MGICVVAVGCAAALQAGQVSDDFVAAARAAYAKDEFCHESIVGKFAKAGVHDDKTPGRTVRWIDVDGVRNVRDIGGWTGLREGRVFRGTELGDVMEKDGNSHGYDLTEVDAIIEREKTMMSVAEREDAYRCIDRLVSDAVPYVLLWHTSEHRLLYWNKFGMPDSVLGRFGDESGVPSYWWYDDDRARELEEAMEGGTCLPSVPLRVDYKSPVSP